MSRRKLGKELTTSSVDTIVEVFSTISSAVKVANNTLGIVNDELEVFREVRMSTKEQRIALAKKEKQLELSELEAEIAQ